VPDQRVEQKIGVFLVAESPMARRGAHYVISQEGDLEVIGEAGSLDEPFTIVGNMTPRTVLLRAIPPQGSFEMVRRIREVSPELTLIVVAEYEDDAGLWQALAAGASAFLTKETIDEQLRLVIRSVANGERPVVENLLRRPHVASQILERFQERAPITKRPELSVIRPSHSEDAVLRLMAAGSPVEEIAEYLDVSPQVVRSHIRSVLRKLDISERTTATVGVDMEDNILTSTRNEVGEKVVAIQPTAQEEAASMVANAREEMEHLVAESIQRLEAEIERQLPPGFVDDD